MDNIVDECVASNSIMCSICLDFVHPEQLICLSRCGCSFCQNCLTLYVTSIVQDRLDPTCPCPAYACPSDGCLTDTEIQTLLTPDLYERYLTRKNQREVETNAALTFCPVAGCSAICNVVVAEPTVNLMNSSSVPPGLIQRVTTWCRQRTSPDSKMSSSSGGIPSVFGLQTAKNTAEQVVEDSSQPRSMSSSKSPNVGLATCPAVRVVCHQCGFTFCARCHMAWHEQSPALCDPSQRPNLSSWRRTTSFRRSTKSRTHTAKALPDLPNSSISPVPKNDQIETSNTVPLVTSSSLDSSTPLVSRDFPDAPSRSRSGKRKRHKGTRKWTSHLVLPPPTPQSSLSSHMDLSMLAVGFPPYPPDAWLKRCPACLVPIERVEGCAQMKCRACKHTFCWYCLSSLDDDFLLRHYDSGTCKGKLGHSRASILGHRVYAITVLAGVSILLLLAAPFVIFSVPCILCAKCHRVCLQRRLRKRHRNDLMVAAMKAPTAASKVPDSGALTLNTRPDSGICVTSSELSEKTVLAEKADIHWSGGPPILGDSKVSPSPGISSSAEPDKFVHAESVVSLSHPS